MPNHIRREHVIHEARRVLRWLRYGGDFANVEDNALIKGDLADRFQWTPRFEERVLNLLTRRGYLVFENGGYGAGPRLLRPNCPKPKQAPLAHCIVRLTVGDSVNLKGVPAIKLVLRLTLSID